MVNKNNIESLGGLALLLLLMALTFVAYYPGLQGPLVLDDWPQLQGVLKSNESGHGLSVILNSTSGPLGRPVSMATFVANVALSGGDVVMLKLTNVVLHLVNGILLFFLISKLLSVLSSASIKRNSSIACVVASLWLLHPLHVSTVLYTVQRMSELACLFSLLGILCYLQFKMSSLEGRRIYWWLGIALACWPLAVLSKESALVLPLFYLLVELYAPAANKRTSLRLVAGILFLLTLSAILLAARFGDVILQAYESRNFTMSERLMTESRIVFHYIFMIFIPLKNSMGFLHDGVVHSRGLISPPSTLASLFGIAGLILATALLKKRHTLISFGIAWFLIGHLMESTILPLELKFEHRNYLPSIGLLLAGVAGISEAISKYRLKIGLAAVAVAGLAISTSIRATIWASEDALYHHIMLVHPESERIALIFSRRLADLKRYGDAVTVLANHDSFTVDLERAFISCLESKNLPAAELDELIQTNPGFLEGEAIHSIIEIANLGLDGQCTFSKDRFLNLLTVLAAQPVGGIYNKDRLMMYRAHYEKSLNKTEQAIATLREVHNLNNSPVPLLLAAHWLFEQNRKNEARNVFFKAKTIADQSARNYRPLLKETAEAIGIQ